MTKQTETHSEFIVYVLKTPLEDAMEPIHYSENG